MKYDDREAVKLLIKKKKCKKKKCRYHRPGGPPESVDPSPSIVLLQWSGRQTQTNGKALISPLTFGESFLRPDVFETPLSRCALCFSSHSSARSFTFELHFTPLYVIDFTNGTTPQIAVLELMCSWIGINFLMIASIFCCLIMEERC